MNSYYEKNVLSVYGREHVIWLFYWNEIEKETALNI